MTAEEKRQCRLGLLLYNSSLDMTNFRCDGRRPPLFFIGKDQLNGRLGEDRTVICLPAWPLVKYARDMNEVADEVVQVVTAIQREGPYLLGGYCFGGYV